MRRVVVSGLGIISPIGNHPKEAFENLIHGRSGITHIEEWKNFTSQGRKLDVLIGGKVKNFDPTQWITPIKDIKRMDRFIQMAIAAAKQAWGQSGLPLHLEGLQAQRAGAVLGVGLLGIDTLLSCAQDLYEKGPHRVSSFFIPAMLSNLATGHLSILFGLQNSNYVCASACASGTHAIGEAMMHIKHNRADIMLCGGAESAMHPLAVCGFSNMGALCSKPYEDPTRASRPFDLHRSGFVMSEGAGILVLEELEHAKKRGATILGEIVGYGSSSDAYHITAPDPEGLGAQMALSQALEMAQAHKESVGYINAHGTSTPFNDRIETAAIKKVFGAYAYQIPISSTKSMTGHLLGAAGAIEAIFTLQAMRAGILPPTINYETPDPECDLNYIPNQALVKKAKLSLSNSFGFGGTNAVLAFSDF